MGAKRGKSQARRNSGNNGSLPGWAWLVIGVVLTIGVVLIAPRVLKSGSSDGFFRPRPNPDAQPATASGNEDDNAAPSQTAVQATDKSAQPEPTRYDFYTMLPGDEVVMSDAELAATERAEAARKARAAQAPAVDPVPAASAPVTAPATPTAASTSAVSDPIRPVADAPYILQAGAFGAPGDAEATKAKVALLGLSARVESAAINGKTVYRVRMGPYGTASELSEAKRKLADGGLPALAIKAR
ncbi:MAG: SPOR domain-containing protein [Luteimonas sp.]